MFFDAHENLEGDSSERQEEMMTAVTVRSPTPEESNEMLGWRRWFYVETYLEHLKRFRLSDRPLVDIICDLCQFPITDTTPMNR